MKKMQIAPSILAADAGMLREEIAKVENAGCEYLHIDIMDGHFVPNLSYGPHIVKSLRPYSKMVFDVHLMLSEPEKYIESFVKAGADLITVHAEATDGADGIIALAEQIHQYGIKAGISLKPGTPADVLKGLLSHFELVLVMSVEPGFGGQSYIESVNEKIRTLRQMAEAENPELDIEVDGGIQSETAALVIEAGVDILVSGSYLFNSENFAKSVESICQE